MIADQYGPYFGAVTSKVYVAQICGQDAQYVYKRMFIKYINDYDKCNASGTRGVYRVFTLVKNQVYEVNDCRSWSNTNRYYIRVSNDDKIVRIKKKEVLLWVQRLASEWMY
jgi:hypothetical protein